MLASSSEIIEHMLSHDESTERNEYVKSLYPDEVVEWQVDGVPLGFKKEDEHLHIVMMEQIKVIDKTRLIKYIGSVSPRFMKILDKRIMISLGMNYKRKKVDKPKCK